MPPRQSPLMKRSFIPQNDATTYRDLLLFEERLKSNATNLQRRKSRYQLFLLQLLAIIAFLLCEIILPPQNSLLAIPYGMMLRRLFPEIYTDATEITLHPYFASGLLFVSVTTLVLFFASGMYSEKIAYANKYVPHANRALRSFNMYLNVRKPSLRTKFYWNPLSFFFPRPNEPPISASRSPSPGTRSRAASTTRTIPTIPPAKSPRGELIFSSRIDKAFREPYERYRSMFERKRDEKEYMEWKNTLLGKLMFWEPPPTPTTGSFSLPSRPASSRGRGSRSATPPVSSSSSVNQGDVISSGRERSGSPNIRSTPPREKTLRRERVETLVELDPSLRTVVLEKSFVERLGR